METNCFIYKLAQADMCLLDDSFTNTRLHVDKETSFNLTLYDSSGNSCQGGENRIEIDLLIQIIIVATGCEKHLGGM